MKVTSQLTNHGFTIINDTQIEPSMMHLNDHQINHKLQQNHMNNYAMQQISGHQKREQNKDKSKNFYA